MTSRAKNSPSGGPESPQRRRVLGGLGVGALAAGIGAAAPVRAAENTAGASPYDYDVVVIGGGFSGVTAARELQKSGLRTVILEARNRLGGRTFTTDLGGHKVEMGGTWVHWWQPFVWAEIERYGLEVEETPGAVPEKMYFPMPDGPRAVDTMAVIPRLAAAFEELFAESRVLWERPFDQSHAWELIEKTEPTTIADRLAGLKVDPDIRVLIESLCTAIGGATSPADVSYVEAARWYALGGWNFITVLDTVARYKIKQGTIGLIDAMIADGKPDIRTATVVTEVQQRPDHVRILTEDGSLLTARAVVETVPNNVLNAISFEPALPEVLRQVAEEKGSAQGYKLYFELDGRYGNIFGVAPAGDYPISDLLTFKNLDRTTLMVGFGFHAQGFDPNDTAAVQAAVARVIPDAKVLNTFGYSWSLDPFARGLHSFYRPGQLARLGDTPRRRQGRLFHGGADNAEGWHGFIDAAIGRGLEVATQVTGFLKQDIG